VRYTYEPDNDLVEETVYVDEAGQTIGAAGRTFEDRRDLVDGVTNRWLLNGQMRPVSQYDYVSDALARRTSVVTQGEAYGSGRWTKFGYDDRNELTESRRFEGTTVGDESSPVPLQQYILAYDPIGNRKWYAGDGIEGAKTYVRNALNQYTSTDKPTVLDMTLRQSRWPARPCLAEQDAACQGFSYDANGNLTGDGKYTYTWDGDNRLRTVTPRSPALGSKKLRLTYDYQNRRIRKEGWSWTGFGWSATRSLDRRFVYDP
jgi:hypothetical protein